MAHDSCYRTAQPSPNKPDSEDFEESLHELHNAHKQEGFALKETYADQQFKKAREIFRNKHDPPTNVNSANTKEHVIREERNIRTMKERIRSSCH